MTEEELVKIIEQHQSAFLNENQEADTAYMSGSISNYIKQVNASLRGDYAPISDADRGSSQENLEGEVSREDN